jgi:hypothetical protein
MLIEEKGGWKKMLFNTCFYSESPGNPCFPAKALGDVFTDTKVIPDPEFKSFDLQTLRHQGPESTLDGSPSSQDL